jgi:hypothetical protein
MAAARRCSSLLPALGVAALLVVLLRPLLFNGYERGADFWVHYWYVWHQSEAVREGAPSLFLHDTSSVFVPRYAFYGGTLYAITGGLGLVVGSVFSVYVATYLLSSVAAYGGWWWLGRQAGLGRLVAHAPALVFATSAYAITLVNARSDWPEHLAVSMMPLLAASAVSVLRADRLGPALALALSGVLFFGSHNLTLLCGATLLVLVSALLLACIPQARRLISARGALRVAAILVPALLVNAWFLLPDLVYQSHTVIAQRVEDWRQWLVQFRFLTATERLFGFGRDASDPVALSYGVFALPALAMAWVAAAWVAGRPRLRDPWSRAALLLAAVAAGVIVTMTHVGLLRGPFAMVQYTFRLESYVNLAISGALLAALVMIARRPLLTRRIAFSALAVILAISVVQAVRQAGFPRDTANSTDLTADPAYYSPNGLTHVNDYGAGDLAVLDTQNLPPLMFPIAKLRDGVISERFEVQPGSLYISNLITVPQFVRMVGATAVATSARGETIIQIDPKARGPVVRITVSEARPPAVVIGRWLSILGLLGLAANLVAIFLRRRHGPVPPPAGDDAALVAAERRGDLAEVYR